MTRLALLLACTALLAACGGTVRESAQEDGARPLAPPTRPAATPGLEAADGRSSFAVANGALRRTSTHTGSVRTYPLERGWKLAAVSANGAWAALRRADQILVLDAERGETSRVELAGDFHVEAISADGSFLFLQQDFVDGSYAVRGYDLAAGQLLPGSLGRKGETVRMQGDAGQVVASPDGRWLLTVYVETATQTAFVHALNLIERIALCIPLPPCTRCDAGDWTLDLAADNRTLRATNGAGGRARIDLQRGRVV